MTEKNIAIIGMACRFPGAKNDQEFWNNLVRGVNSIGEIPPERWDIDKYYSPNIDEPNKSISKWCGLLDHIDQFDNRFFSISPREAKQMDPQQRLLLEETWHCLEDSGVSLKTIQEKKTAVYVGAMGGDHQINATAPDVVTDSYAVLGNYEAILANRISYVFGFQGISLSINAACAASLVALHQAKISLLSGESDYAFVAGINLNFQPWKYISFSKARMLSPDGQCQTFDKDANGYVPGDGVGVLLLQPLEKAIRARNHIYGIIKGSAVNHGGQALSITAPRVEAQRDVILAAYKDAGINPDTVTYVEAHGTGTSLGDPIEVEALTWAFRQYTDGRHFCRLGSVKSNIGHLEAAAGIAGVIKVLLMMHHQKIPPTLNIKTPNPVINFAESPFVVATELQNWQSQTADLPLRAGVSSFGFGGVNSHTLIESFSTENVLLNDFKNEVADSKTSGHLFILSAKSKKALKNTLDGWKNFVDSEEYSEYHLIDICATLMTGREQFPYRYGCYVHNKDELTAFLFKDIPSFAKPDTHEWCLRVGELLWENFADVQPLLEQEPLVKKYLKTVQQCLEAQDISSEIKDGFQSTTWPPSLKPLYSFMVNYASLSALMEFGLTPSLITGEKTGLWCVLTLSGMMTLEDALAVLSAQKTLEQIKLARCQLPFYDPTTHQTLSLYHFDEDYLSSLIDNLSIPALEVERLVMEKARLLKDSQFTFQKYLQEWSLIFDQKFGKEMESIFYNDQFIFNADGKYRKEQVLLTLFIEIALRQLEQKWHLTSTRVTEPRFNELVDLVIDGVMSKEVVIELFLNPSPNLATIAAQLNERQSHLDVNKPYQLIKKHSQSIGVINNLSEWFEKAMASDSSKSTLQNRSYFEFGQLNQPTTPDSSRHIALTSFTDNTFKDTLLKLWLKGVDIKWDILYPDGTFNKVALPTYGFDRASFWLTKTDNETLTQQKHIAPNQDNNIISKLQPRDMHYRRVLSPHDSMIRDHIITGKPMLPGAGMIQMGLDVLQQALNQPVNTLQNIVFKTPCIIEAEVDIEVEIHPIDKKFVLKTETQELCEAEYEPKTNKSFPLLDLSSRTLGQPQKSEQIYESLSRLGYRYGKGLQVIKNIWQYEDKWLLELSVPISEKEPTTPLNPALLDGLFQSVLAIEYFLAGQPPKDNTLHVPFTMKSFNVLSDMTEHCFVCIDKNDIQRKGGNIYAQLRAYDVDGTGILLIEDMQFKQVPANFNQTASLEIPKISPIEQHKYYLPVWQEESLSHSLEKFPETVLIFSDSQGVGQALSEKFQNAVIVMAAQQYAQINQNTYEFKVSDGSDYRRILEQFPSVKNIYFLWGITANETITTVAEFEVFENQTVMSLFRLCKVLSERKVPIELIIVTSHLHQVVTDEAPLFPYTSPLLGLAKVLELENPSISIRCVDIEFDNLALSLALLIKEQGTIPFKEIAYRGGKRYIKTIKAQAALPVNHEQSITFKQKGVYLIIGGLGGIGLALSRFLAENFQAQLVLVGRGALNENKQQQIQIIQQLGGEVLYLSGDVTRYDDMQRVIETAKQRFGAINGVIHSALILADGQIKNMSESIFRQALAPKSKGSFILNQVTLNEKLDFIVLFSSVLDLKGNAGQCNYVAGCAFQDAYAHYLRGIHQRPAVVINWGYWGEIGIVTNTHFKNILKNQGIESLTTREGIAGFRMAIESGQSQVIVAKLNERFQTAGLTKTEMIVKQIEGEILQQNLNQDLELGMLEVEQYGQLLLLKAFQSMQLIQPEGERYIKRQLITQIGIIEKYDRLFDALLEILERSDVIRLDNEEIIVTNKVKELSDSNKARFIQRFPDKQAHFNLLEAALTDLMEILTGKVKATDVLFPNSSMKLVEGFYRENRFADYYNQLVAKYIRYEIENRIRQSSGQSQKVKILEVGAGTGGTSVKVLEQIASFEAQVEYCYTDISVAFAKYGKKQFGPRYPFMRFSTLNIEEVSEKKRAELGNFDIIFATNVVHATQNLAKTFSEIQRLLKPQGCLLLSELTYVQDFLTLTFGLLDGWWLFEDAKLRLPHSPLLSPLGWKAFYTQMGFEKVSVFGNPSQDLNSHKQCVIVGYNSMLNQKNLPSSLSTPIVPSQASHQSVTPRAADKGVQRRQLIQKITALVATALEQSPSQISVDDPFSKLGVDSIVGVETINAINKELNLDLSSTVIFDYPSIKELSEYIFKQSPNLLLESVDVLTPASDGGGNLALISGLPTEPQTTNEMILSTNLSVVLEIPHPGQVDTLTFREMVREKPSFGEISIQVSSSALNYKDVLKVYGSLAPEVIEDTFFGDTLGMECAGTIVAVGEGVERFQVGDEIVALMPGSFRSYATIPTTYVIPKPRQLSFEEAPIYMGYMTAYYGLIDVARLQKGEKILIHNATGGVGLAAVHIAQWIGAEIFATAGSEEKRVFLRKSLGIKYVMDSRTLTFAEEIRQFTSGYGVDVIINAIAGKALYESFSLLAPYGRFIEIGKRDISENNPLPMRHFNRNLSFAAIDIDRMLVERQSIIQRLLIDISKGFDKVYFYPLPTKVFAMGEITKAFRYMAQNKHIGKIVVTFKISPKVQSEESYEYQNVTTEHQANMGKWEEQPMYFGKDNDVAIIGISGQFPGARNLEEFWENLANGQNSISEVPPNRWDINQYFDSDTTKPNKTYCKYGGFLADIDQFDPLFFNISPKEAELMDPQQRLFLEHSWKALEDAGGGSGERVGIYVGVRSSDYLTHILDNQQALDAHVFMGTDSSILAARLAYDLNLKGPCLAIDTACSSSLVAIHLACEQVKTGQIDMAIAGGVFVMTTPNFHIMTSKTNMLSKDGQCQTFDNHANGFVPSEGVGVLVLKSLPKAIEEGDHIYGVIKGSGINQDGKTNGITAPSTRSQTRLELEVYKQANITPDTISYVEAHGTGTKLGDPIEIEALTNAYRQYTTQKQFCAIGSVKTNIGHAITAAGVAGVIKVLLSLKHKKIPPSIHFKTPNEHINFKDSPFYVNTELRDWQTESGMPRRATISSFGFSGTNAHIVLEEYEQPRPVSDFRRQYPQLMVLSAKNDNRLQVVAQRMVNFLEKQPDDILWSNLAYTLQVGREAMEERLAMVASSVDELKNKLNQYVQGSTEREDFYRGNVKQNRAKIDLLIDGKAGEAFLRIATEERELTKLAQLWVSGVDIDWQLLYPNQKPQRISLPTYPFARERYWVPVSESDHKTVGDVKGYVAKLHPLLGSNTSTLLAQRFTTQLTGHEFYLAEHIIDKQKVLPGVAYLEMARAAGELAGERCIQKLINIVWARPISVSEQPKHVHISLTPFQQQVQFEISSYDENQQRQVHAQGKLVSEEESQPEPEFLDIETIKARCPKVITAKDFYSLLKEKGLNLGSSFQVVQELFSNETESLSVLELPSKRQEGWDDFVLHPSMMDGSLQTAILGVFRETKTLHVPFAMGTVEIFKPLTTRCYAHASLANQKHDLKFNVRIYDDKGQLLVKIKDFSARAFQAPVDTPVKMYYHSVWEKSTLDSNSITQISAVGSVLLFDTDNTRYQRFKERLKSEVILVTPGDCYQESGTQKYSINPLSPADYQKLLAALTQQNSGLPSHVIHLWSQVPFVNDDAALNTQLDMSLFSIFHLSQAILRQKPSKPIQLLYVYLETDEARQPQYAALSGFAKTIRLENSKFNYKTIAVPTLDNVVDIVLREFQARYGVEIRYDDNQRWIKHLQEFDKAEDAQTTTLLKENGVYLITGGSGGLGLIFAEYLAKHFKAKLVLTGRSSLNEEQTNKIQSLNSLDAEVIYQQADISKRNEVVNLIAQTKSRFKEINGIIHSAGMIKDALVLKKTPDEIAAVLAPKVYGTIYLDEATKNEPLDFWVLFSSVAAVFGNVGQCDYAYANAFMDNFAVKREELRASQKRFGKTLSINWPLWQSGGMRVDEQTEKLLANRMGMVVLKTEAGLKAFNQALSSDNSQFMVIEGHCQKVRQMLGVQEAPSKPVTATLMSSKSKADTDDLAKLQKDLLTFVSTILKISVNDIDRDEDISEYGFDSISFTELANQINEQYQLSITPVIFFEYPSIGAVSQFLYQEYQERFFDYYQDTLKPVSEVSELAASTTVVEEELKLKSRFQRLPIQTQPPTETTSIAIIGMSGIMPQSEDLESFWQHLEARDDLITEVPPERWDWQAYYGDSTLEKNKTKAKWGGFMPAVAQFDPLFFGISPREAELMDPQQRLFLETVWKTIEDAGYKASDLSGTQTGVFVGVATADYSELLRNNAIEIEAHTSTGTVFSILANRVSYLLNLHGPSEPIDTACSSALVAIHRAVEAIRSGTCEMAIAGGVNVMLTPTLTLSFSKAGMLSEDGRCKSFDKRANGYVRGEGVGAIWLKPLEKAQADGDRIYAVIKGTAENHGGHATSLTAPNPNAQTQLLVSAYENAQIDPSTVSYIEAHGTGTSLGDPIEINGLKNAFASFSKKSRKSLPEQPHCGIGSVKTNIGHLEAAAGMAGIFKVLLAMKHKTLPGLLHFSELNPYIQLQDSPFYVVTKNQPWTPLTLTSGQKIPRRAGVSSFGFGGANAHIVLEEYDFPLPPIASTPAQLIVLSAKNDKRLKAIAKQMVDFLEKQPDIPWSNFAYTLQVGREAMEERLAMVVSSVDDLFDKLTQYAQGQTEIENFYQGNVKTNQAKSELLIKGKSGEAFLKVAIEEKELSQLAQLWVSGINIDWQLLYPNPKPQRISLPTYPFARERYWVPVLRKPIVAKHDQITQLHPLLESNTSTLVEQKFTTQFTGEEFYLSDHIVAEQKTLPGVVYLEMARAAGELAGEQTVTRLTNLVWAKPITVSDTPKSVHISLYPAEPQIEFEISTIDDFGARQVHAQGKLTYGKPATFETIDIEAIQNRSLETWNHAKCYQLFQTTGLNYGSSFKTIQALYRNDTEALSRLQLPSGLTDDFNDFVWHPSLMDGALQTVIGLMGQPTDSQPYIPFALGSVELKGSLSELCYAYVRRANQTDSGINKFHISILDETGEVQVRLADFSVRALKPQTETPVTMYYQSVWKSGPFSEPTQALKLDTVLLFDTNDNRHARLKERLNSQVILVMPGEAYQELGPDTYSINPNNPTDYQKLLATLNQPNSKLPSHIIHLWSVVPFINDEAALKTQLEMGLYSIFHLSQAILSLKPVDLIQLLYLYLESDDAQQPQYAAVSGFAKTLRLENPKLNYKTVALPALDNVVDMVLTEFQTPELEVRYDSVQRWVKHLPEIDELPDADTPTLLKENGVYLITGGAGGLGLIFAEYLAKHFKARLVLTGRSALNAEQTDKIQKLNELGASVIYQPADISKRKDVVNLITQTKSRFNEINGIIHSAGVIKDALVIKKTPDEMALVLAPKVYGTIYLDEATSLEPLDFLVLFSSVAAVMGNMGQCDYAYANAFMDNFAAEREKQRAIQKRSGKTLSINWPLWSEGGMRVDEQSVRWMEKRTGLVAIKTEEGLNAFEKALTLDTDQVAVIFGAKTKVNTYLNGQSSSAPDSAKLVLKNVKKSAPFSKPDLPKNVEKSLLALCSELLKVKESDLELETDFGDYGMDSIMMMSMLNRIEAMYGQAIEPNAIAEYPTIKQLASYLIEQNIVKVEMSSESVIPAHSETDTLELNQPDENFFSPKTSPNKTRFLQSVSNQNVSKIAVISMASRFPGASSPERFWENLVNGKKSITEVPKDRWKIADYYTSDKNVPTNKTYSKWGGYIENIDLFDAAYFGISDTDALVMDPQQRILLELTQALLDRAGYSKTEIENKQVGVFIGGAESAYRKNNQDKIPAECRNIIVNTIQNMMAARISDYYNLKGPALTTDTACSSSLVSIHQACQSLMQGESELAIAGGIELLIDPFIHIAFSKAEVLSDEGESYIFDQRAKGIVLGEGAGLVLLKPLEKAIEAGDPVLGVINSSSVNNDGHTMGLTVPSLAGQKAVIIDAIEKSGVDPATITYLEAHGTGTLLGDPIEIKAITQVYRTFTQDKQYCAVGSVKSNLGHLLHAAGIASFIKVLLALQHKIIPPTLNCEKPHPRFNFEDSPFYPITGPAQWMPKNGLRCAAISSFGFGGTNCHLIVEEFNQSLVSKRESFPATQFNRKRYWLGKKIVDAQAANMAFYQDIITKLSQGKLTPEQAKQLENDRML